MYKILIPGRGSFGWTGGTDFLCFLTEGILYQSGNDLFTLFIEEPSAYYTPPRFFLKFNFLKKFYEVFQRYSSIFGFNRCKNQQRYRDYLRRFGPVVKSIGYSQFDHNSFDLFFCCIEIIEGVDPLRCVFHLPDCQHRYLSHFFSKEECDYRDKNFKEIIDTNAVIVVHSTAVQKDLIEFYGANSKNISVLPFTPAVPDDWYRDKSYRLKKYNLPKKYCIISNQFWVHKDHKTAIKALSILDDQSICLVLTGATDDYRFPDYFQEIVDLIGTLNLVDRIFIMGVIDKRDQIEIMKNSLVCLQPTLFEGSRGGLSVYDAIALGVGCIVSDISVNRELPNEVVTFFKTGDAENLATTITNYLATPLEKLPVQVLKNRQKNFLKERSDALKQIMMQTILCNKQDSQNS